MRVKWRTEAKALKNEQRSVIMEVLAGGGVSILGIAAVAVVAVILGVVAFNIIRRFF